MNKQTIIVLAVFAALLVAVFATREDHVSVGVHKLELPRVEKAQVTALELRGARSARLEKEGGGWRVMDPAKPEQKYVADEALVTRAVEALGELRSADFVTDRAEVQAEDELDDAKGLQLKVTSTGAEPLQVVIGKAGRNGGFYVRKAGTNDVFVARSGLDQAVRRDVKGWRKRSVLALKPEEMTQLTLRAKDGEAVTLKAGSNPGEWSVGEGAKLPPEFRLDSGLVEQVARQVSSLTAQDFLEGAEAADTATGLGGAHDTVEAKLKDGKSVLVHLGPVPEGKPDAPVAARVEGDNQVYQLSPFNAGALRKRLADLRDLRLFRFEPPLADRLKVQVGATTVVVSREDKQWKLLEPKSPPAGFSFDSAQVESVLSWLSSMRATRVFDGVPNDAQLGLNAPTALVQVSLGEAPPQTLRLGKEAPPGAGGAKEISARVSPSSLAYAVPESVKTRLAQGVQLFKKPEAPPGGGQQFQGLEQLPPEIRQQLEAQLKARQQQQQ